MFNPLASLTDNLTAFGYTHIAVGHGMRAAEAADGRVVFTGRYEATWAWLQVQAQSAHDREWREGSEEAGPFSLVAAYGDDPEHCPPVDDSISSY